MSLMRDEALSCAGRAADFLAHGLGPALAAGGALRVRGIRRLELLGRGSSGHVGLVLRYLFAQQGGLDVSDAMPSLASDRQVLEHLARGALMAISQSGQSPDLLRYAVGARRAGASVLALVNAEGSPLAACADLLVPLCAGPEHSVAATKSVLLSLLAGLAVLAGLRDDAALRESLLALPARLDAAQACDWSAMTKLLHGARAAYLVARGAELGIAHELALKVSEVLGVPALAFSSAEFLHGPLGAVSAQTPVIGLASDPLALSSVLAALERSREQGAPTLLAHGLVASASVPAAQLPLPAASGQPGDLLLALPPAYLAIEAAARAAGRDPDRPVGLRKITETL